MDSHVLLSNFLHNPLSDHSMIICNFFSGGGFALYRGVNINYIYQIILPSDGLYLFDTSWPSAFLVVIL